MTALKHLKSNGNNASFTWSSIQLKIEVKILSQKTSLMRLTYESNNEKSLKKELKEILLYLFTMNSLR